MYLRLPKRGFTNIFANKYVIVNVEDLNRFEDGAEVNPVTLIEIGLIKNVRDGIRILGSGELNRKLTVQAHGFTQSAAEKIQAAGGTVEVI